MRCTLPVIRAMLCIAGLALGHVSTAQTESDERALLDVKNGISISKEPKFLLNLRFRMQARLGLNTVSGEDLSTDKVEGRIRRLRLRFDGHVLNRKIQYYIQLAFSKADMDLESGAIAQPIRDAILYYNFSPNFYMGFGQSKLPGNRERVVSSGNLQFADRSIANGAFTLDRDFGVFGYWTLPAGGTLFNLKGAVTTGDGRNASAINSGMDYTGRLEFLPLGKFEGSGDYSEGDLEREVTPKLSIAAGYSFNDDAVRTGGQLGSDLYAPRDMGTFIADLMFKWKGVGAMFEVFDRRTSDPFTYDADGAQRIALEGTAMNSQLSYCWPKHWELAGRYAFVQPSTRLRSSVKKSEEAILGLTKYLNGHRIKAHLNVGYRWTEGDAALDHPGNSWNAMVQVEFGI
ncbi:MAG: porin [Flavobacteriales bacterium]|nr:porin [Flavobacteriales bacterium]